MNVGSCRFMLGQCYLANGEGQKVGDTPKTLNNQSKQKFKLILKHNTEGKHLFLLLGVALKFWAERLQSALTGHLFLFPLSFFQALQCFQEAATEVEKEEFLMKLTGTEDEEAASTPRLQYYNKVVVTWVPTC